MENLRKIREILQSKIPQGEGIRYAVPSFWTELGWNSPAAPASVNPFEFFSRRIDAILACAPEPRLTGEAGDWSRRAVVYNLFVRLTGAFDHNQNGKLDLPANDEGFRETGTFLKAIALLPYIKRLGANTVHLLPVTAIGKDGNKGRLGSPYAIRNPFKLDENLAEPFLGLGAETEFKAFVEAAHHLGINVVLEFVFRTAAKDSDWVKKNPHWFYWIKESLADRPQGSRDENFYGSPVFNEEALRKIREKVGNGDLAKSLPPSESYQSMFSPPPKPENVHMENGRWIGRLEDGTRLKIPGAFSDWPPDDPQPPWGDVTYLRMFDHPDFNYIAYNTVRMYDLELSKPENALHDLWRTITDIIPHYQRGFGIDGVMIDMGHALPLPLFGGIVKKAREINPDFAFWEESFAPSQASREHGYNAAIGYIWVDEVEPAKLKKLIERYSQERMPLPFFGTPESHNSPRAAYFPAGVAYSRYSLLINSFLPAIPFIHSGFELGEKGSVNTGLRFSKEDLEKFPAENLPLFSEGALDWSNPEQFCALVRHVVDLRKRFEPLLANPDPATFRTIHQYHPDVVAFERLDGAHHLWVVANSNMNGEAYFEMALPEGVASVGRLLGENAFFLDGGRVKLSLRPSEVQVLQLK